MHEAMAATLDTVVEQIKKIQQDARVRGNFARPRWPMIVFNSPKGWTGPKMVDGLQSCLEVWIHFHQDFVRRRCRRHFLGSEMRSAESN